MQNVYRTAIQPWLFATTERGLYVNAKQRHIANEMFSCCLLLLAGKCHDPYYSMCIKEAVS